MEYRSLRSRLGSDISCFLTGSLPHTDPAAAARFVLERPWILPCWPELPRRSDAELMLTRARRACLEQHPVWTREELAGLFEFIDLAANQNKLPLVKGQLAGPLTISLHVEELGGNLSEKLKFAVEAVLREARWQIEQLSQVASAVLLVIDEPELCRWDDLDEEFQKHLLEEYTYLSVCLQELGAHSGIHICGAFPPGFLHLPLELFSFELVRYPLSQYFAADVISCWEDAVARGVVLAAGVAPAVEEGSEYDRVVELAERNFAELQHQLLKFASKNSCLLWSADCGHAASSMDWIERLYRAPLKQIVGDEVTLDR